MNFLIANGSRFASPEINGTSNGTPETFTETSCPPLGGPVQWNPVLRPLKGVAH
jgi:hypothetical protein